MPPTWRSAKPSDLSTINRIADRIHAGLPERAEVLAEKTELFPEGFRRHGVVETYFDTAVVVTVLVLLVCRAYRDSDREELRFEDFVLSHQPE